jgi:hypothetical protein
MTSFGLRDEDLGLLHLRPLAHDPGDNVHCESHKQDSPQPVVEDFRLKNCYLGTLFCGHIFTIERVRYASLELLSPILGQACNANPSKKQLEPKPKNPKLES